MIVNKQKIIENIINTINSKIKKVSERFYNTWKTKTNQIIVMDELNEINFNDFMYVESKNKYLVGEFEKCNGLQKEELMKEFEKVLPVSDRHKRSLARNSQIPIVNIKKNKTPYFLFCVDNRDIIKGENPTMKDISIKRELSRRWKSLDDIRKEYFINLAQNNNTNNIPEKKPINSFLNFCKNNRSVVKSELPELKAKGITRELSRRWKNLDLVGKNAYKLTPGVDTLVNLNEGIQPEGIQPEGIQPEGIQPDNTGDQPIVQKRALSGYIIFCNEKRQEAQMENPAMNPQKIVKELAGRWRDLNDIEKDIYKLQAFNIKSNMNNV